MRCGGRKELREIEISLLLEGIQRHYGCDFREYSPAYLNRRIFKCAADEQVQTVSGLQDRILHNADCMKRFFDAMSIGVTSMFRDPQFYLSFREKVVPVLRKLPSLRIWHVGCASGEEAYSMTILLKEEGLLDKCRIYATDMNGDLLERARAGIYSAKEMKKYTVKYQEAGGTDTFSMYYTAQYNHVILSSDLKKNIVWFQHNLATDAPFQEFNVILCRNVLIYFSKALAIRVHRLLLESLAPRGHLCLGARESLRFTTCERNYELVDARQKIYRRIR